MANERVQRRIERLLDEADEAVSRYDGVPLFVEELTRMVVESGLLHEVDGSYELSGPLPPLAIPSTLQNSLTTRLDRLSSARESVQLAAVLGREFSYELIQAVSPLDDAALARDLGQLVASEFLYQRGLPPESTYIFKHVEAVNHLTKGLELLETLPDPSEQAAQELALQTMLGQSLIQTRGYTAPEVQQAFSRARELIDLLGEISQYFQVMSGLFAYYFVRAEYQSGLEVAEQCLEAAQRGQDALHMLMAHRHIGTTMVLTGEPARAREHLLQGFSRYEIQQHRSLAQTYGQEPTSAGLIFSSRSLWLLGYPDQASSDLGEAVALAQEVSHPYNLAFVELNAAACNIQWHALQSALRYAEAVLDRTQEQGFTGLLPGAQNLQGGCWVRMGRTEEGIANIRQGLATYAVVGFRHGWLEAQAWLAEAYSITGRAQDGLEALAEAFAHLEETGERYWEAELYRIKGELLLFQVVSGKAFQVKLSKGFCCLLKSFTLPGFSGGVIYPKRIADLDWNQDVGEENYIGTGPYKIAKWDVENKVVLERYEGYVPRNEPGAFLAGAQIAYFDKIEMIEIPSEETKIAGLKTGEWHVVDDPALDFYRDLKDYSGITTVVNRPGKLSSVVPSMGASPSDNKILRQAVQAAMNVNDYMTALEGDPALWSLCPSLFFCFHADEITSGDFTKLYNEADLDKARQLVAESGYDGEEWLHLNANDYGTLTPLGPIFKRDLEDVGINVSMPGIDWSTVTSYLFDPNNFEWNSFSNWGPTASSTTRSSTATSTL